MSAQLGLIIGAVVLVVGVPLTLVICCLDWRRIFGMRSMDEVRLHRRYAEARDQISAVFAATTAKMDRRTGGGDPFNLGHGRRW